METIECDRCGRFVPSEEHDICPFCRETYTLQAALTSDRAAVRALVEAMPECTGDWVKGSGARRTHKPCTSGKPGMWNWCDGENYYYCDAHHLEDDDQHEAHWAPALRALLERMKGW